MCDIVSNFSVLVGLRPHAKWKWINFQNYVFNMLCSAFSSGGYPKIAKALTQISRAEFKRISYFSTINLYFDQSRTLNSTLGTFQKILTIANGSNWGDVGRALTGYPWYYQSANKWNYMRYSFICLNQMAFSLDQAKLN